MLLKPWMALVNNRDYDYDLMLISIDSFLQIPAVTFLVI